MADQKIMSGARGQIRLNSVLIGTITNISWNTAYNAQDVFVCGRTGPAAIEYVGAEPVSGSLSGWRFVGLGAHALMGLPSLDQLLTSDYLTIEVTDRVTGKTVGHITGVRLLGMGTGVSERQLSQMNIPFRGMLHHDENVTNAEAQGATELPVVEE